ncbi:RNA-directed DNA polymerase, eukaryota, reverse transcriptase zinc-binding domain protein [Tanacetum coccineum]
MLLFKVDFEKAFDSVSWRFLDHVMERLGFSSTWRKWIMAGLKSSRASILVNGSPTSEFSLKRGLRQGDPLSPFLFIIVMEGLHIALKDGLTANLFQGVKIGSSEIRLSHLFYADDVIILSEWNQCDMDNIIRILNVFYLASGLKINISKSNLYGVGVSSDDIESMAAGTGCSASNLPFSYLGLPIGSNINRIANWNSLIERFKIRLSGWKENVLSLGGRLTLIKSVFGNLGIYYFSIFKVPEAVLKTLESLRVSFFWGATGDSRKLAWIKWSNILASLDKGGLGVGSLKAFNNSLLLKWRWRLLNKPSALWVEVLKLIHGNEAGIELKGCQTNGLWARIVGTIYHIHSSGYDWRHPVNGGRALADLNNLLMDIGSLNVEVDRDCVVSSLSTDGSYSVSFIRKHIDNYMIANSLPSTRWCKIIPRKVNIFMWRLLLDRLPHRLNLSSRGLDIDSILCPVCSEHVESNSHAFFSCSAASNIWRLVRGWCDLKIPTLSSCDEWDIVFSQADLIDTSSRHELELLFSPMYDEYFNRGNQSVCMPSVVSGLQQQDISPTLNIQYTSEPSIPSTNFNTEKNNNNQAVNAQFNVKEFINPFCTPVHEVVESFSRNVDLSYMHTFYQRHRFDNHWTKDHPLEQIHGNPSKPMQTRRQLATYPEMCMFALTVSKVTRTIKEYGLDFAAGLKQCRKNFFSSTDSVSRNSLTNPLEKPLLVYSGYGRTKRIKTILSFAIRHGLWLRDMMDVKEAFLNGTLKEKVYGIVSGRVRESSLTPERRLPLRKALFGLKQAA